jgi:hypothetical protein
LSEKAKFCSNCGHPVATQAITKSIIDSKYLKHSTSLPTPKKILADDLALNGIACTAFVLPQMLLQQFSELLDAYGTIPLVLIGVSDPSNAQMMATQFIHRLAPRGQLKYVCLIGNWEEIPPYEIKNPVDDGDTHCKTDSLYGVLETFDGEDILSAIPVVPVSRIPVSDVQVLEKLFFQQVSDRTPLEAFRFAVSAECWQHATGAIVERFANNGSEALFVEGPRPANGVVSQGVLTSPAWDQVSLEQHFSAVQLPQNALLLFNVHGQPDYPTWVGQRGQEYPEIFRPGTVENYNYSVLFSEACYGGALGYDEPSVVEHFFANEGKAFVGCSVIAWGSSSDDLSAADVLALNFLSSLQNGLSFANALNHAKFELAQEGPWNDDITQKTILSFNLFGAPWQRYLSNGYQNTISSSRPSPGSRLDDLRNRVRSRLSDRRESATSGLEDIRENYRARLPEKAKFFLMDQGEALRQFAHFRDSAKISSIVSEFRLSIESCKFERIESKKQPGYRISGKTEAKGLTQRFLIVTDENGKYTRTLVSKSR